VGLLTEAPGLWDSLTVADNLIVYARLHGVSQPGVRVTEALEMVGLTDRATDRAGALSKGLKQRVALARAILHQPALVLLDEPTAGLDPASARHVRDLIAGLRREGRAVLVSTHNLSEAEALSDRIAVLQTRLIACDTPARLRAAGGAARLTIELERDAQAFAGDARAAGLDVDRVEAGVLSGTLSDAHLTADIVTALVGAGARIRRVDPARQSLEEVYLSLVRDAEDVS
jgi:ABC-2 type transport system ATP-binding protein